ncbi:MAG TPA: CTP synthase [Anaerolineaceae bacterium]|jgi:CTP synthase|nr:CTP synthase [Anaerolineaceae bacterium]HPT24317.1 CTP synthase [Anaerolineaceae bacterium]
MATKYIFFTGGVLSSVGKGVTASAIGRLLKARGISVTIQKLDPYLNVDPGTLSPYQHGEVFVLDDGAETDLDLGHYERFCDLRLKRTSTVTTGQVYEEVINRERRGDYLGGTIQVIPHITNEIKRRIDLVGRTSGADIALIEVGGTVGDIESQPFLEAIREMRNDLGRNNSAFVHLTWLPYLKATNETKTKPTQHSVRELRSIGILPDMIIARSDYPVGRDLCDKIAQFCDVPVEGVVPLVTADMLYRIPLILESMGVADYLLKRLALEPNQPPDLDGWRWIVDELSREKDKVRIGLVGKYVELHDAYLSVREALTHAALFCGVSVELDWISATDLEKGIGLERLGQVDGIVVPGGFGSRGVEGKILAAKYARENKVPYLGLCLGLQVMTIEFARNVLGLKDANSSEIDQLTPHPVIDLMADQRYLEKMGGTMRLGLYPCVIRPGTKAYQYYQRESVDERHRHRYEFNNQYRDLCEQNGLVISGQSPDGVLVEMAEIQDHPYMLASQFHPEFLSRPNRPHPLFLGLIHAICEAKGLGNDIIPPAGLYKQPDGKPD